MKSILLALLVFLSLQSCAQNKWYYVHPSGNDNNDGGELTPFKTISKINTLILKAGDKVFIHGDGVYTEKIILQADDGGTASNPVIIASYGDKMPTIGGVYAHNTGGIEIHSLIVKGSGRTSNTENGVEFFIDQETDLHHVRLIDLTIFGFGGRGIFVRAGNTTAGFNRFMINNCTVYDNGMAGIETLGNWYERNGVWGSMYNHKRIEVIETTTYGNTGVPTYTQNHSGSGIMITGVDSALIKNCLAYDNGGLNGNPYAGAIGIWLAEAKNSVIQNSVSHSNKGGSGKDGGGFDIDGGSQNCIIQYCYSYNNDGAGFALFEWGSLNPFSNNTIRYNVSQNDGLKNGYSGLSLWGNIKDDEVYNNTIYTETIGLGFIGGAMSGTKIRNNIFFVSGNGKIVNADGAPNVVLEANNYYSSGTPHFVWGGKSYFSYDQWRSASNREQLGKGKNVDPLFVGAGTGDMGYKLKSGSPMIGAGIDLRISGVNIGTKDYFNQPVSSTVNIGADAFYNTALPLPPRPPSTVVSRPSSTENTSFRLAPNPARNTITILKAGNVSEKIKIQIVNSLGVVVYDKEKNFNGSLTIGIGKFPNGSYVVLINDVSVPLLIIR